MEEIDDEFPEACPICRKVTNNILLHINKKDSCKEKIGPQLYDKWKNEANKRKKRKYMSKYIESGKHSKAQDRYIQKCKNLDKESFLQKQRQAKAKYWNKERIVSGKQGSGKRKEAFKNLCKNCLWKLKRGRIPIEYTLNRFHLVEAETGEDDEEVHAWLKEIDSDLLLRVIEFQKVALIPKSQWLTAEKLVKDNPAKDDLKDRLYRLIGNLQAYEHKNTKEVLIPDQYKKSKATDCGWYPLPEVFSEEDEATLLNLLATITGEEEEIMNEDIEDLLKISNENMTVALSYAKWKYRIEIFKCCH